MSGVILLALRVAISAALYAFLGWALYVLWRDYKRQAEVLTSHQPPPLTLAILGVGDPVRHTFIQAEVVIGRGALCDFSLDEQTVSAEHARLSYHHTQWWLEDMGSTNGTFLNGEQVLAPVVLTNLDELRLGQVSARIEIGVKQHAS